jgi:hypothetical protein
MQRCTKSSAHGGSIFSNFLKIIKMIQLIIAFFLALTPHHNTAPTQGSGTQVSTQDTGGETEPIPPKPPKP